MVLGGPELGRPESRVDQLVVRLEREILDRGLQAGVRIGTKDEIRQRYQVAAGTLNEALRVLHARGHASLRRGPNGGVFVAEPPGRLALANLVLGFEADPNDVRDCLVVRDALEPVVAADAAQHRRGDDLVSVKAALEAMRGAATDPTAYLHQNWQLHRAIARAGHNEVAQRFYLALLDLLESELEDVSDQDDSFARGMADNLVLHEELVAAIEAHDPAAAAATALRHASSLQAASEVRLLPAKTRRRPA
ncbi:MAG: FadR/GntR family transcriptional regulator [Acidimicrobiia bacterium]